MARLLFKHTRVIGSPIFATLIAAFAQDRREEQRQSWGFVMAGRPSFPPPPVLDRSCWAQPICRSAALSFFCADAGNAPPCDAQNPMAGTALGLRPGRCV